MQSEGIMHELGHLLGLGHGGADGKGNSDDINFKPNYHSIMNYTWEIPLPWMFEDKSLIGGPNIKVNENGDSDMTDIAWALDYSEVKFNDLDEDDLDETKGIGGHADHWVRTGPVPPVPVLESGPVDWSRDDGDLNGTPDDETGVKEAQINHIRASKPLTPALLTVLQF